MTTRKVTRRVTNTAADESSLLGALVPGYVEAQERRGQAEVAESDVLPTDGLACTATATGIEVGEVVAGGPLFTQVRLPPGWSRKPTEHPLWTYLVDELGRTRARVGYKAAFYDRWASVSPVRRFEIVLDHRLPDGALASVTDCGAVVFTSATYPHARRVVGRETAEDRESQAGACRAARDECRSWLRERGYPDHEDPGAYWRGGERAASAPLRTRHYDADFRRDPQTSLHCWACQRDLRPDRPYSEVFLVDGTQLLHPGDVARAGELNGIRAWVPVGACCARKIGAEWTRRHAGPASAGDATPGQG